MQVEHMCRLWKCITLQLTQDTRMRLVENSDYFLPTEYVVQYSYENFINYTVSITPPPAKKNQNKFLPLRFLQ